MNINEFADNQINYAQHENKCENDEIQQELSNHDLQYLQKNAIILAPLTISCMASGINNNTKYILQSAVGGMLELPLHRFKNGEVVKVESLANNDFSIQGVVIKVTESQIIVLTKQEVTTGEIPERLKMFKMANSVSFKRMINAMNDLKRLSDDPSDLVKVLFNQMEPTFNNIEKIDFVDEMLNDSQKRAVKHCLQANDLALIHGPPGTGKTQTLIEIIKQFVNRGKKVLVCGPSNISVDNIVERLGHSKLEIVRLGHPARILDSVLLHSLEYRLQFSDGGQIVNDVRKDLNNNLQALGKCRRKGDRRVIYQELKNLRTEVTIGY